MNVGYCLFSFKRAVHISFFFDLVSSRFLHNYQPNCRDRIIRKKEKKEIPLWTDIRYTIHDTRYTIPIQCTSSHYSHSSASSVAAL